MNSWLSPADVGRRVTIRRQTLGGLRDTVGHLQAWDGGLTGTLTVIDRHDTPVAIKATDVTAARVVPPEVSALRLQTITEGAWPVSDAEPLGEWLLRFVGGEARRTNSVRATGVPSGDLLHALDYVREWYARRGVRANLQTPSPGVLDDVLMDHGWTPYSDSHFMVATDVAASEPADNVRIDSAPSNDWLTVAAPDLARGLAMPMALATHQRFITVYDDQTPVSVGRVVAHDGWGIVTTVRTAEAATRNGYGRACMLAVHAEGRSLGVSQFMLQVLVTNERALPLYRDLGYTVHHDYRYFLAPE